MSAAPVRGRTEPERDFVASVRVLDSALEQVEHSVASRPAERGGALLGLRDKPVVTEFIYDELAATTHVTYVPSRELAGRVQAIESRFGLQFKGILHSHPGSFDRPSGQDEIELAVGLDLNPHLAVYLAPIVTTQPAGARDHELWLPSGKVSFYAARRLRGGGASVRAESARAIPLVRDARAVAHALHVSTPPETFVTSLDGSQMLAATITLNDGSELLYLTTEHYPAYAPLLFLTPAGGVTVQRQLTWPLDVDADQRLLAATHDVLEPAPAPARVLAVGLKERQPDSLDAAARVLVVGAGSVGSFAAEQLVRAGLGRIDLLDPDVVEPANLPRTVYELADLGVPKVDALRRVLRQVQPEIGGESIGRTVQDLTDEELTALVAGADLLFAATDDPAAQRRLNATAYAAGVPAVFPGLYAGAKGGEVVIVQPPRTACYLCATAARHVLDEHAETEPGHDYGTGRLHGEIAHSTDIHHLTTAAVRVALALLAPEGSATREFITPVIEGGTTYLTMSMTRDYWFFPQLFDDVPNQHAYQSVWITPDRRADCSVCGESPVAITDVAGPSIEELQMLASNAFTDEPPDTRSPYA